jgi:galactokinase
MTGAGFGGACVALVAKGRADSAVDAALADYAGAGHRGERLV